MASNGSLPLQCNVCNKTFCGRIPAQQHYASAQHKKKVDNAKRAAYKLSAYVCTVCNISCDTQKILDAHNQSPRHNAEVEKQKRQAHQFGDPGARPDPRNSAGPAPEYVFDGDKGYCNICALELTSRSHAQDHLKGQKHEKKKKQKEMLKNTSFQPNREPAVNMGAPGSARVGTGYTINNMCADSAKFCQLCQVPFSCADNAQQHYISSGHKKKVALAELAAQGELLPLRCDVCDCSFSGQESARDHNNSTKHKRNVENKNIKTSAGNFTDNEKMGVNLNQSPTYAGRNQNGISANTQMMTQPVRTSTNTNEFDRVTSGMSNLNISSHQSLERFQVITKQQECEDDSIIKPYPAVESVPAIQQSHDNEPVTVENLKADPSSTNTFQNEASQHFRGEYQRSQSENDERKIQAEIHTSLQSEPSRDPSMSSQDSFNDDGSMRVFRNNLSSMPSFGRGRGFLDLQNSSAIIGKLLEKDREVHTARTEPMFGQPARTEPVFGHGGSQDTVTKPIDSDGSGDYLAGNTNNSAGQRSGDSYRAQGIYNTDHAQFNRGGFQQANFAKAPGVNFQENEHAFTQGNYREEFDTPTAQPLNAREVSPQLVYEGRASPHVHQESADREEFTFDRYACRGRCNVCNIELTSTNHMFQHTTGKKHISAAAIWRQARVGSQRYGSALVCTICSVQFTGPEARQQHFESQAHLQKEMQAKGLDQSYFCDVCKIACSGEISYKQHLLGAQHQKKAGALPGLIPAGAGFDRTIWYQCDVCNCQVNSFEQLEIHKRSHMAQFRPDAAGLGVDRTTWYTCKICMCNLNTESQLRIHEQSPGHLKKMATTGAQQQFTAGAQQLFPSSGLGQKDLTLSCQTPQTNYQESGQLTPLQSFLSEELFPAEFLPNTDNDGDTHKVEASPQASDGEPFKLVISDTPVPFQERFAAASCNGADDSAAGPESAGGGGAKRGHGSDLAFATRSRGSADRKTDHAGSGESKGAFDTSGAGPRLDLGARPKELSPSQSHVNPYAATHNFYCHTCRRPMNTRESYEAHIRGKHHMAKVCTEPAPVRQHLGAQQLPQSYQPKTVTSPRNYQMELYSKAMRQDALCFLPTGTGKTLVSVLAISAMLERYPSRNILFLVDKVLLVLQQAKYIRQELQGSNFLRYNPDSEDMGQLCRRGLHVASVCMGQQNTHGVPLWKHDVVVVTAAFCQNLLDKEILRWDDFSLVVFDEAHHCEKAHPFNALLKTFHNPVSPARHRPKVLGLTASPAGKADVPKTVVMLESLILNMGGVAMAVVESPDHVQTLKQYQSNAKMIILSSSQAGAGESDVNMLTFEQELNIYILQCYMKLLAVSDIKNIFNFKGISGGMSTPDIGSLAAEFVETYLDVLQSSLGCVSSDSMEKVTFSQLTRHVSGVCRALSSLLEGGSLAMLEEIVELQNSQYGFNFARELGLQCDQLVIHVQNFDPAQQDEGQDGGFPGLGQLLRVLTEGATSGAGGQRSASISLVLVKQRGTAHRLTKLLKSCPELVRQGLDTATVVGHGGSGASERGMSVNQQKRVLEEIKQFKYQIIVATSVAEEGVDWPECERVISMYPPSTVTALVQMRGRARRKNSQFVVLCASQGEEDKLNDIITRESHMIQATQILVERNRQQRAE